MFLSKLYNGVYYLWYDDDSGKRRKVSTRTQSKAEARQFLRDFLKDEKQKKLKLQNIYLSKFSQEYLTYSSGVHSFHTQRSIKIAFREFIRILSDKPLQKISIRDIENFVATKKREASDRTARTYFVTLASAFQSAVRWKYLSSNPFRSVGKPKLPELQPAFLLKADFKLLLNATLDHDMRELFHFAVSTGMRLGEILALQWSDIDLLRGIVQIRNSATFTTKTKQNRLVPLSDNLREMIKKRKEDAACELVFHRNTRKLREEFVSKLFKEAVRAAGLSEKLHFHSLRHTFASWLVQDGVSLYEVQKLLGHSNIAVTQVYSHLQPETLHTTVNRIQIARN